MRILFFSISLFFSYAVSAQSLRDSLFAGKLKQDTSKTTISQAAAPKNQNDTVGLIAPDSLNTLYKEKMKEWKRFIEYYAPTMINETTASRKVKNGEYHIIATCEIALDGTVTTTSISCDPPNEFIVSNVAEMMKKAPVLAPRIYSDGKKRVTKIKQPLTIIKQ